MEDIKPIRVFLAVAEARSFTNAAKALDLTPASVTRIVAKLEQELGQQLLLRTTRQVSLTSAGAVVASRYRPLLRELDQTTSEIVATSLPDRGRLRINAPMSMGLRLMPGIVDSFRLAYPNISLDIKFTDTLVDIVEDDCDLAIRVSGPPNDKSTIWRKICEVQRHVYAAPSLFNRIREPGTPDDLVAQHCLSYNSTDEPEIWHFRKGGINRQIKAGIGVVSNNGDFLHSLAATGNGIIYLPDFIVSDSLENGRLNRLFPDWETQSLWLTLFYPPYDRLPPLVATFSDFFEDFLKDVEGMSFQTGNS